VAAIELEITKSPPQLTDLPEKKDKDNQEILPGEKVA